MLTKELPAIFQRSQIMNVIAYNLPLEPFVRELSDVSLGVCQQVGHIVKVDSLVEMTSRQVPASAKGTPARHFEESRIAPSPWNC